MKYNKEIIIISNNINSLRESAQNLQDELDFIKDELTEKDKRYDTLYNTCSNLDGAITSISNAWEEIEELNNQ